MNEPVTVSNAAAERRTTALPEHLPALDGLRGLAALLVISHHFLFEVGGSSRFEALVHRFVIVGTWCGVDLFFVLSGLLITRILLRTKPGPSYFTSFYGRRALRIFPLYYLLLLVVFVVMPAVSSGWRALLPPGQVYFWTYTANLLPTPPESRLVGHLWSLMVEEHFYLVWPFLVWIASPRGLVRICVGAVALATAVRFGMLASGFGPPSVYTFTLARLDGLACGALLAIHFARKGGPDGRDRRVARIAAVASALALLPIAKHDTAFFLYGAWVQRFGYTLLAVLFTSLLVLAVDAPRTSAASRFLTSRSMTFFGKYSYGAYVYHLPLMTLAFEPLHVRQHIDAVVGHEMGMVVYFAFAVVETYGLAWLSYELFESRFLRMKRFFEYAKRAPEPPIEPAGALDAMRR